MPKWKFVLTNNKTGESTDLLAEFEPAETEPDAEEFGCCNVESSDTAHGEALERLGYSVTIIEDK